MFTGIVQGIASVRALTEQPGLRRITLGFPPGFSHGLNMGASVSVDGVCLTVSGLQAPDAADFDVMQQTLSLTTLARLTPGDRVNVERASREGAEVGGHHLSGHIDFRATISSILTPQNNRVLRCKVAAPWMRYLFARGYIAVNGASLTLAEVHRARDGAGWFEIWLIPETLRMTTFAQQQVGSAVNVEIDRQTQVFVDTIRDAMQSVVASMAVKKKAAGKKAAKKK
jgi:riboflavin synthase